MQTENISISSSQISVITVVIIIISLIQYVRTLFCEVVEHRTSLPCNMVLLSLLAIKKLAFITSSLRKKVSETIQPVLRRNGIRQTGNNPRYCMRVDTIPDHQKITIS